MTTISTVAPFSVAAPTRADPTTFSSRGDTIMTEMVAMVPDINTTVGEMNTVAGEVNAAAAAALASSGTASDSAAAALVSENAAAASAATALAAPGTSATSATSLTIAAGAQSLTIQTGKSIPIGAHVMVARTSDVSKWMVGSVVSYDSGTGALVLTVADGDFEGAGTFTDWTVSISAPRGAAGSIPIAAGAGTVNAITATYSPAITLTDRQLAAFVSTGANTSTTPTFAPNGLTAHTIVARGGLALAAGEIGAAGYVGMLQYSLANTRWELLNPIVATAGPLPTLVAGDQKASGTHGGGSVQYDITQTRTLNTVEVNTISGASLASNAITLPAGTYDVFAVAPEYGSNSHMLLLYNVSDATYALTGCSTAGGSSKGSMATVFGQITVSAPKAFTLRHYVNTSTPTYGLGYAASVTGQVETYAKVIFKKVA